MHCHSLIKTKRTFKKREIPFIRTEMKKRWEIPQTRKEVELSPFTWKSVGAPVLSRLPPGPRKSSGGLVPLWVWDFRERGELTDHTSPDPSSPGAYVLCEVHVLDCGSRNCNLGQGWKAGDTWLSQSAVPTGCGWSASSAFRERERASLLCQLIILHSRLKYLKRQTARFTYFIVMKNITKH